MSIGNTPSSNESHAANASSCARGPRPPRDKRCDERSFFEVIYEPGDRISYSYASWSFSPDQVLDHSILDSESFADRWNEGEKIVIFGIRFNKCDFEGDFTSKTPSFKNCKFDRCDFGLSKWRRARFKDCRFDRCSFSMASFEFCEFRDCMFLEISMSGNETVLTNSTFTNPDDFVKSAGTNLDRDILKKRGTTADYQLMRLDGTKAGIARAIMASHSVNGSEHDYYKSVKTYQVSSNRSRISLLKHELCQKPAMHIAMLKLLGLVVAYLEKIIINTAGNLNNWGASVARPALIGGLIIAFFTFIYWMSGLRPNIFKSLVASADITLLVGYTKHVTSADKSAHQLLYALNMITGLVWYSVFVPTIIGRISRVR